MMAGRCPITASQRPTVLIHITLPLPQPSGASNRSVTTQVKAQFFPLLYAFIFSGKKIKNEDEENASI